MFPFCMWGTLLPIAMWAQVRRAQFFRSISSIIPSKKRILYWGTLMVKPDMYWFLCLISINPIYKKQRILISNIFSLIGYETIFKGEALFYFNLILFLKIRIFFELRTFMCYLSSHIIFHICSFFLNLLNLLQQ